jgi:hypothetical protein
MEIYWDQIFYATDFIDGPYLTHSLSLKSADLHYRGFSATYRKGGRYGPHWFDYSKVSTEQKWRDLMGYYTRYGDVRDLLLYDESHYVIMNAGDEMTLTFDATQLPDLPDGWVRDFIIYSAGWVKDGDFNTAYGNQVDPYPFHGITSYPYDANEKFPASEEMQKYFNVYNTREVTTEAFRNEIRNYDE